MAAGEAWSGRTTLLSSLDNLIADRLRAERIFGLRFKQSPFVPKKQRAEATGVLPILHGDRFLGRIDARHDRDANALLVAGLRLEPNMPRSAATARVMRDAFEELGRFLRVGEVRVTPSCRTAGAASWQADAMDHADHVRLIRGAVTPGTTWAELGSGDGAFTLALAELVGSEGLDRLGRP